jgi:hypothetical protein
VVGVLGLILLPLGFLHDRLLFMSDSLTYIGAARSLASGGGYMDHGVPVTVWPPGYSVVLAALMMAGSDTVVGYKGLNVVLGLLAALVHVRLFARFAGRGTAWLAVLAGATMFPWVFYMQAVLAEMLFALAAALFLFAGARATENGGWRWFLLATGAAAVAPVVRLAGVALWVPWFLLALREGGLLGNGKTVAWGRLARAALAGLAVIAPFGIFLLRNLVLTGHMTGYALGSSAEYDLSLRKVGIEHATLFLKVWFNLRGYLHILVVPDQVGIARIGTLSPWVHMACAMAWACIGLGGVRLGKSRGGRWTMLAVAAYLAMLLFNSWYDIRYLVPILPVLALCMAQGVGILACGAARRIPFLGERLSQPRVSAAFLSLLLGANLVFLLASPQAKRLRSREYSGDVQRLYEACRFVAQRPEPGRVLVAGGGGFEAFWSGREACSILSLIDASTGAVNTAVPRDVAFIIADETEFSPYRQAYLEPLLAANSGRVEVAYSAGGTRVYRYNP